MKTFVKPDTITIKQLSGKKVAIDGMNMLYQILYNPVQMKKGLQDIFYRDSTQRVITHLYGWLQKIINFYKSKIFPIVVFDGRPHPLKRNISLNQAHNFIIARENYKKAIREGRKKDAKYWALHPSYMWFQCLHESKELLNAAGIPIIMAPGEGEAQCIALQNENIVDYTISNDYDTILYRGKNIIRKITFQTRINEKGKWKTRTGKIELINYRKVLSEMKISYKQLIDWSILVGNDYFEGISQLGAQKALQTIRYYNTIEAIVEAHPSLFPENFIEKVTIIRNQFFNPIVISDLKKFDFKPKPLNRLGLESLLLEKHTLNKERVKRYLDRLEKAYNIFIKKQDEWEIDVDSLSYKPISFDKATQRHLSRAKRNKKTQVNFELKFVSAAKHD